MSNSYRLVALFWGHAIERSQWGYAIERSQWSIYITIQNIRWGLSSISHSEAWHQALTIINLYHLKIQFKNNNNIKMFVNKNISRKESTSTSHGLYSHLMRPSNKRSQWSFRIIQWIKLMNVHTPTPPKIFITSIRGLKTYLICHSISLRRKITQKSKNSSPTKYYHKFKNSHTLQQKIQGETYMEINKIFMT